ncbi:MAG: hypothetical protein ACLQJR_31115 [Stellaceae bacterium]
MSGFRSGTLSGIAAALVALPALLPGALPAAGADAQPPDAAMRAEIARGVVAAGRCAKLVWKTEDYSSCIDALVGSAMTDDAAKAPFQLGVYCTAFYTTALAYRDWSRKPTSGAAAHADGDLLRETVLDQYDSCLAQAQRVKLEAGQICAASGLRCAELNPLIDRWKTVTRADE